MPVASCTRASLRGFLRRCAIVVGLGCVFSLKVGSYGDGSF